MLMNGEEGRIAAGMSCNPACMLLQAATQLDVDSVCMDCEDGVADSRKEDARNSIVQLLSELDFGRSERAVRINPVASGLADEDLRALFTGKTLPDVLVLPKVTCPCQ